MSLFNRNLKEETILVEGMKCVHCASKVEDALKKHKVKASITLESKLVKVKYNEKKISLDYIKKIIEEVGFQCL